MSAKGFFITGTDTGVGKTVVTACLASLFRKHHVNAGVMKPVETGVTSGGGKISDAEFLLRASGVRDTLPEVSPCRLTTPASPYQAARLENRSVDTAEITGAFYRLAQRHDLMLVEGIGGLLTPITRTFRVIDLVAEWSLPLIVVSRLTLGTINHTLLTIGAAESLGIKLAGVIFNHPDDGATSAIEKTAPAAVRELSGVRVLGELPFIRDVSSFPAKLLAGIEESIDFDFLRTL
ncbi:MAG: dethiobiotin synthase [Nitrospinales bacterium]